MSKSKPSRIGRILSVYYLFMYCQEVSVKEVTDQMPGETSATIRRDIKLLKNAGVFQTEYSRKAKAFITLGFEFVEPVFKSEKEREKIERIRRLCILMNELEKFEFEEKPLHIELHKRLFPNASDKTRQRDFGALAEIGYIVRHEIEYVPDEDKERWCYSLEVPYSTYSLPTFHEKKW